ncbi:unnamed protein product [Haemonchus placei]|uniref:Amidase domain-containing protein n=1 Tax=Haemonchus placei TaxID=6290 RepID=A0A0N4WU94_HAEPC|nr:unnamed protein product [Haemonchus placei]
MLIIGVLILGVAGYLAYLYVRWQQRQQELSVIVEKRRHERQFLMDAALKSAELLDAQRRDMIASWTFQQLRENLQSGTVTCIEVLRAYQWKAIKAHEKTNCITIAAINFFKEAEEWASEWDRKAQEKSFVKPAFFGIPISLKECVPLEGYDQTRGFVQDVYAPTKVDAVMVQHVKRLGMIPFVQTNVPQSMLSYSCSNPVYGTTNNPLDKERTSGGSSGGEAAIIAAGGSVIGIGGDVGGSIRIPCHFTGIAGIKPSHLRFSHRGVCGSVPGRPLINSNDGPMTVDIETTVDFLREMWRDDWASVQDPYIPPVLWNEEQYKGGSTYRIGYYVDDGWFTPVPAIQVITAPKHNVPGKLFAACCYTAVFNLLDFAAGVVKVTETTAEDDQKLREEYPETDPWYRTAKEACKVCSTDYYLMDLVFLTFIKRSR